MMDIKRICDNIEDVIFHNVDISEGTEELEAIMAAVTCELLSRWKAKEDKKPDRIAKAIDEIERLNEKIKKYRNVLKEVAATDCGDGDYLEDLAREVLQEK